MKLRDVINGFDGRHTDELRSAVATFDAIDATNLIRICKGDGAVAATWIVKALCEQGRGGELDLVQAFTVLRDHLDWEAALHLLQTVQYAPKAAIAQADVIEGLLDHPKTLVRVWALDAYVRISRIMPELRPDARERVATALLAKAASLRVRARALDKLLE